MLGDDPTLPAELEADIPQPMLRVENEALDVLANVVVGGCRLLERVDVVDDLVEVSWAAGFTKNFDANEIVQAPVPRLEELAKPAATGFLQDLDL